MEQIKFLDLDGLKLVLKKLKEHGYQGYGLSEEDFTAELKAKYDALAAASSVEDLTALFERVSAVEKLIDSDKDGAINKFNEIVAFLDGIEDTQTLAPFVEKVAGIESGAQKNTVTSVAGKTGAVTLAKADVGLGNVDNTSDANKPVSTATQTALNGKVDKVSGKGLSTNDYTTAEKNAVATIGDKVDKVSGKGLSSNDYTTAEKTAVATIGDKLNKSDLVAITDTEIDSLLAPLA